MLRATPVQYQPGKQEKMAVGKDHHVLKHKQSFNSSRKQDFRCVGLEDVRESTPKCYTVCSLFKTKAAKTRLVFEGTSSFQRTKQCWRAIRRATIFCLADDS